MRRSPLIWLLTILAVVAAPAMAQVHAYPYPGLTVGEGHRYERDRIQARSDQQEALARQQRLETRQTLAELQARRLPPPEQPSSYAPLRSVDRERVLRQSAATLRRATTQHGVGQIDAWLDRPPR